MIQGIQEYEQICKTTPVLAERKKIKKKKTPVLSIKIGHGESNLYWWSDRHFKPNLAGLLAFGRVKPFRRQGKHDIVVEHRRLLKFMPSKFRTTYAFCFAERPHASFDVVA